MTWYELYLFLHVATAVIWIGGAFMMQGFAIRAAAAPDPVRLVNTAGDIEFLGVRIFTPASLVLLVSGILLVVDGSWDWGEPFVSVGIAVWALSFLAGVTFLGPESGRISKLVDAEGPESVEARRRIRRIFLYSRTELVLLFAVVFMMTVKLGT